MTSPKVVPIDGPAIPEVYIRKVPHVQKLALRKRPGDKQPRRRGVYRMADYVYDALHAIRYEHARSERAIGGHPKRNPRVWDWVGEILELFAVDHVRQCYGMDLQEFVLRRMRGEQLSRIRNAGREVVPVQCEKCGHVRVTLEGAK